MNDAGLWTSLGVEKKLSSRWKVLLSEEFRFNENISELGTVFIDAGIEYKLLKKFFVSGNYRFIGVKMIDNSYSFRHRYYLDLSYKYKSGNWGINLRERFESQYKDVMSSETGLVPRNYLRSKLSLKYDFGKSKPYLSCELFYRMNNSLGNEIDKIRPAIGIDYELNKYFGVDLFYLLNKELTGKNPLTEYVAGIGINWKL